MARNRSENGEIPPTFENRAGVLELRQCVRLHS